MKEYKDEPSNFKDVAKYFAKDFIVSCVYETAQYPFEVLMVRIITDMGDVRIYANPLDCLT